MKAFKSKKISRLNLVIYLIVIFLSIALFAQVWGFIDNIILNPNEFSELSIDKPIISPFGGSYLILKSEILENNNDVYQKIQRNEFMYDTLRSLFYIILFILLILQLKKIIYSLKQKPFFLNENLKIVKNISYILGIWVIIDFIFYQAFQLFIPLSLVQDNYNYMPLNKMFLLSLFVSINYSLLLAAFAFYVISVVLKKVLN